VATMTVMLDLYRLEMLHLRISATVLAMQLFMFFALWTDATLDSS
jgi:hypothetical protein